MSVTVSIVVPFYKVEAYIGQCAESLLEQTYPDIEYVFVNDGSPDGSRDILADVISRHPLRASRVKIVDKPNGGLPQARKTGLEHCSGDFVFNVDSDDWLERDAVEKIVAAAEASAADLVYFYAWKEFGDGKRRVITDRVFPSPQAFSDAFLSHKAHPGVCLKCFRRSLYTPEIFFPRFGNYEDVVQSLQLVDRASKAVLVPEPLYHYRRSDGGAMSRKSRAARRREAVRNLLDLYSFYKDAPDVSPIRRCYRKILRKARLWALLYDRSVFREYPFL